MYQTIHVPRFMKNMQENKQTPKLILTLPVPITGEEKKLS